MFISQEVICRWNPTFFYHVFPICFLQVLSPPLRNGNFAGGRRELALRLLSNGQEEEPDQHLDATDDEEEEEEILLNR